MEFDGPGATELTLIRYADERIGVLISNYDWSAKPDEDYDITYILNGQSYGGNSIGTKAGIRRGFIGFFPKSFATDFAKGETLHIFLGETRVDQLSLSGTSNAMGLVNRCLIKVRAEIAAAEREKAKFAHIPEDPFAKVAPDGSVREPTSPKPIALEIWAAQIQQNYPASALREKAQGAVSVQLEISRSGRVIDCKVTKSSGHEGLDFGACTSIRRYARFSPALDEAGRAVEGTFQTTITYSLNR